MTFLTRLGGGGGMIIMIIECDYECEWNENTGMIKTVAVRMVVVDGIDVWQDRDWNHIAAGESN